MGSNNSSISNKSQAGSSVNSGSNDLDMNDDEDEDDDDKYNQEMFLKRRQEEKQK